jgi:hypothetical protein
MADITPSTLVGVVDNVVSRTLPAAEAIVAGDAVRIDTSTGKFTKANATTVAEARIFGIAANKAAAGFPVLAVRRGVIDLGGLSGLAYDADVYLSNTDGKLADATPKRNEAQTVSITGTPSGGNFTLTFDGVTTGNIAYNASASDVLTALRALSNIEADDVSATGGALPGTAVVVTFAGKYAGTDVALMTANSAGLTGGSTPTASVSTTTTPIIEKVVGRVVPSFSSGGTANKLLQVECQ